ncbi:vWA domain-containing protein [Arsenicicoccus bolidensis]|uniref:vWA domain-containing protein n=1 Tax=Arsenicicoccus bolidensis TaxID=229480 RepID=UPI00258024FD|nr:MULTISPECIES: vWA domain-containing protein [Arsenicicoccus]
MARPVRGGRRRPPQLREAHRPAAGRQHPRRPRDALGHGRHGHLGLATRPLTPDAWRSWMLGRSTWAQTGHPEWASFSIRMADPATSPTAAIGFGAMITLANGGPLAKAPDYAEPSDKDLAVIKVEHRITSLAGNDGDVLPDQDDTLSEVTSRASAYVTTERADAADNAVDPTVPLAAVPLAGGAASVPLSVLGVGATADDAPGAASARGFRAYLTSASGLAALRAAGLRAPDGAAPTDHPASVAYAAPLRPAAVPLPVLQQTVQAWRGMHSRISSMVLVDASGSMNQHFAGGATSRIDLVRGLAGNVYQTASPRARSGVCFFHTSNELGTPLIERPTDLAVNESADAGRQHIDVVVQAMSNVTIKGGTPLYQAVREAYAYTLDEYDPGYVNQLVILSDGAPRHHQPGHARPAPHLPQRGQGPPATRQDHLPGLRRRGRHGGVAGHRQRHRWPCGPGQQPVRDEGGRQPGALLALTPAARLRTRHGDGTTWPPAHRCGARRRA